MSRDPAVELKLAYAQEVLKVAENNYARTCQLAQSRAMAEADVEVVWLALCKARLDVALLELEAQKGD